MNPDDLAKILDELGQRLGPAGQHVFELAVRQQIINGITNLVIGVLCVILIGVSFVGARRLAVHEEQKAKEDRYHSSDAGLGWVLAVVAFIVLGLMAVFAFSQALSYFLNPEYAAIKEILGALPR